MSIRTGDTCNVYVLHMTAAPIFTEFSINGENVLLKAKTRIRE